MSLTVRGLRVTYDETVALDGVDLDVGEAAVVAVIGPSGSGKSSLLRAVAGLVTPDAGSVRWDGADLASVPVHRRDFGLMFQDHALFAHRSVGENVAYGLRARHRPRAERAARVAAMLELVGLTGFDARRVDELSGGERQRVALARALAPAPRLLMLDEPLASVDRERRDRLGRDLRTIVTGAATPTLLVTHDLDEAFTLADEIVVLAGGRVAQAGPAEEVWRRPVDEPTARFLGVGNVLAARVVAGRATTPWGPVGAPGAAEGTRVGWRPRDLHVTTDGPVTGTVGATWFRRDHFALEVDTDVGRLTVAAPSRHAVGTRVAIGADLGAAVVLPPSAEAHGH